MAKFALPMKDYYLQGRMIPEDVVQSVSETGSGILKHRDSVLSPAQANEEIKESSGFMTDEPITPVREVDTA